MTAVEEIRRAAALMRERATAATPGPWESTPNGRILGPPRPEHANERELAEILSFTIGETLNFGTADHIASWHPAPVLAVADLLDDCAWAISTQRIKPTSALARRGLAVARAYLDGERP